MIELKLTHSLLIRDLLDLLRLVHPLIDKDFALNDLIILLFIDILLLHLFTVLIVMLNRISQDESAACGLIRGVVAECVWIWFYAGWTVLDGVIGRRLDCVVHLINQARRVAWPHRMVVVRFQILLLGHVTVWMGARLLLFLLIIPGHNGHQIGKVELLLLVSKYLFNCSTCTIWLQTIVRVLYGHRVDHGFLILLLLLSKVRRQQWRLHILFGAVKSALLLLIRLIGYQWYLLRRRFVRNHYRLRVVVWWLQAHHALWKFRWSGGLRQRILLLLFSDCWKCFSIILQHRPLISWQPFTVRGSRCRNIGSFINCLRKTIFAFRIIIIVWIEFWKELLDIRAKLVRLTYLFVVHECSGLYLSLFCWFSVVKFLWVLTYDL